jgi:hypothetical protein
MSGAAGHEAAVKRRKTSHLLKAGGKRKIVQRMLDRLAEEDHVTDFHQTTRVP